MRNLACRSVLTYLTLWLVAAPARAVVPTVPTFGPPTRVDFISNNGNLTHDVPNSISLDGLRLVFASNRNGGHFEIFMASRPDTNSPFDSITQAPFVNINAGSSYQVHSGVISSDGLELFYTSRQSGAVIHRATRSDTSQSFSSPVALTGLGTGSAYRGVEYISPDGLRLYLADNGSGAGMRVASRPDLASAFGTPSGAPFVNVSPTEEYTLTPDELQLFYNPGPVSMSWSSRAGPSIPFDPVVDIPTITSFGESLSPILAGSQLFFLHGGDIWTATATTPIPEPASAALLLTPLLLTRRRGARSRL